MLPPALRSPGSLALLLVGLFMAGGCTAARMQLDPALHAAAPEQQVSGVAWAQFRKPMNFAGYTATVTRGGWKKTSQTKIGPYQRAESEQSFTYAMSGGTPASWTGSCSFGTSKQGVLFPISDDAGLVCVLLPQGGGGWQLQLASKGELYRANTLTGTMTDGKTTLSIAMVHQLAGAAFQSARPVGYEIRDAAGVAVAAVQTGGPHFVWIDPRLPVEQQTAIAAGAFGLLVTGSAADDINE